MGTTAQRPESPEKCKLQFLIMEIVNVKISDLKFADYNPRKWSGKAFEDLKKGIQKFGIVDPIIVNSAPERHNVIIGGHFRVHVAKELGIQDIPVLYVNIPDIKTEQELNLRLNKNTGEWDYELLASYFDSDMLTDIGWNPEELEAIFNANTDFEPGSEDEQSRLDTKSKVKCPECGHEFVPSKYAEDEDED